ncbi:MAG: dTDP-4-dehydrorhamnose 3,5-epimerase [Spirochaetes bacterium GWF1_31_7]|nr:MAG: dTDP-4-dehydrorhamnose 3,5-epimerase [Spirochaetes bacterium GWE1_32_154]OHD47031.1 MAG: dTDP-4-dehydrorhamnose 3,5-epimerase [Spirochaetes bacterium GWE2_31_10]OHD51980.1 MAG: dTDP-4-dehydrorhamnose 3,5-epimerase [Spirochaetes bacterium GWF1_31_7]OHD76419.1 MAG: dTDP-4-dehydrorhamnose 3,5-epimerase [Spirochaetes bacterium RIFOXYB1_FULL_32_8]HBD94262.1 dTDP-4-dehydrorhamnose 3,5-epimerase [Spirochaetia bacterium]
MSLDIKRFNIEGPILIMPKVFTDERGFFLETYKKSDFSEIGISKDFVQDNHSMSKKGTIRGVHYQLPPFEQAKLVRVVKGRVWDVAVDLRKNSPTFKKWVGVELSDKDNFMFYIPNGFGHGFIALEDDTHFLYKCTNIYNKQSEAGIRWNDPDIQIEWPLMENILVSEKDRILPNYISARFFD